MNYTTHNFNNNYYYNNTRYLIISCIILTVTLPLCCKSSFVHQEWKGAIEDAVKSALSNTETHRSDGEIRTIRSNFLPGRGNPTRRGDKPLEVYIGIAAPANNQVVVKAFNKTLANISSALMAGEYGAAYRNLILLPFYIELPENEKFSSSLLVSSCAALNGRKVAALAVLGRSEAAATAALAAAQAGIPVLRAVSKPTAFQTTLAESIHPLEARMEITPRETLQALRALLLHTHWHTFTILADFKTCSTIELRKELLTIINTPPLIPNINSLPEFITPQSLFRQMADISRLTRGVVVLFCNLHTVQRVLDQAKKLNMLDGHFVWLWIDTDNAMNKVKNTEKEVYNSQDEFTSQSPDPFFKIESMRRSKEEKHAADQRERQQGAKRMENLLDRNRRNVESIEEQDGAESGKGDVNSRSRDVGKEDDSKDFNINYNEDLNNYTRGSNKNNQREYYDSKYSTSLPIGLRTSLRNPNLIYINNRELLSDKSNINHFKTKIKDGQFRDDQSDFNYLSNNIKDNDFINIININEGVESSKIALNHKTNSKTPGSNIRNINSNDKDYEALDMHNNNYDNMYISDNNKFIAKRSDDSVMHLDNVHNMKTTARSLSDFSKISSLNVDAAEQAVPEVHRANKRTDRMWSFSKFEDEITSASANMTNVFDSFPIGLLALRTLPSKSERQLIRGAVRAMSGALRKVLADDDSPHWDVLSRQTASCWNPPSRHYSNYSTLFVRELNDIAEDSLVGNKFSRDGTEKLDRSLVGNFEILNLVPDNDKTKDSNQINTNNNKLKWRSVGRIVGKNVQIDTIMWPGGDIIVSGLSAQARSVFRIVTALAPPFVMEGELDEDGQCLRGLPCHRVLTSDKDNLTLVFNEMETQERMEEEAEEIIVQGSFFPHLKYHSSNYESSDEKFLLFQNKYRYKTNCCYGLSMDLLENIADELEFDFHLYIVSDGLFGHRKLIRRHINRDFKAHYRESKNPNIKSDFKREFRNGNFDSETTEHSEVTPADMKWNGIVGDLISGAAHMSFAALSVSSARSEVIDFSIPYYFSGVSLLAAPHDATETPLLAFLLPFSPELWITIFTSLNVTAIAVAIYEWLSPFGLNPWGRQRSKNFSMSSALWVMWGLLCGHLVAFKAPKSWPNKFLINVWGGFSVIFVASYTANIAALYAGLFFQNAQVDYSDKNLFTLRVGAPRASAPENFVQKINPPLWDHMKKYVLLDIEDGIKRLKNASLDILLADTPVLDYYRATDHGCKLQKVTDVDMYEDTYAVAMTKGFPLKDSISALISKYLANGYMDILQEKWYGGLPCFKLRNDYGIQPRPLGVAAVAGVFILLGVGMAVGCLILLVEHLFYRYTLPILRHKPKGTIWRSRNIMFFSQKLYRFINCVELVSPHHAARELVHTLRQGQITSLFQKSVKRKEHEQRRRRKSKAQFFEMIQEIRRVQQEERDQPLEAVTEIDSEPASPTEGNSGTSPPKKLNFLSPAGGDNKLKSPLKTKIFNKELFKSPRAKNKKRKQSTGGLNVRRFSTDSVFSSHSMLRFENTSVAIGRRLSKDTTCLTNSPPDINSRRSSYMDFDKLGSRSPNVSSDSIDVKDKVATIPKYRGKQFLDSSPSNYATINKNRISLGSSFGASNSGYPTEARSFQNVSEETEAINNDPHTSTSADDLHSKPEFPHSELQRKHKKTFDELQEQLNKRSEMKKLGKPPVRRTVSQQAEGSGSKKNHQIKIQIEDHSSPPVKEVFAKQRHKSLDSDETLEDRRRRPRTPDCFPKDFSKTSDRSSGESSDHGRDLQVPCKSGGSSRSTSSPDPSCRLSHETSLPPAPPYPNVVPRTSDGKSPLERLTKEELVLLWRSSESELRSHFLTALREKENSEPP